MATWTQRGNIRGPQGAQGIQGIQGVQGPPGLDGAGIAISGSVNTYADLPTNLGNTQTDRGKGYLVNSDGLLYIWSGTSFPPDGQGVGFRGPRGLQGDPGPAGQQGIQGQQGVQGNTGATGQRGSQWFDGVGPPGSISDSLVNDYYLDGLTGTYYQLVP